MRLRLFIALSLSSGFLKKIGFLEKEIDEKYGVKFPWIDLKKLHLTIIFLGHLTADDYLKVTEVLKNLSWQKRLELKIKKLAYGPPQTKKMIWLYIERNENLKELKDLIEKMLNENRVSYKREEREFLPHINLARLKISHNLPLIEKELNWQVIFNRLALYKSNLRSSGVEYEKLLELVLNFHQ